MAVTIKSDKKWRNLLYGYDLPKKWRKEFDYLTDEEFEIHDFAKYRGWVYDVHEFMRIPQGTGGGFPELAAWDGYMSDTYSSGVVIKLSSDGEQYKIGRFYS
jgi:hypothetical protein